MVGQEPVRSEAGEMAEASSVCTGEEIKAVLLSVMAERGLTEEHLCLVISVLRESEFWRRNFVQNVANPIVHLRGRPPVS